MKQATVDHGTRAPAAVAIVGATATGKSELALRLCDQLEAEIVNADALQVYRGLDLGTAKPSAEDRRRARHHLIDILEPGEVYSAGEFARRARAAIADIRRRGKVAILVGGSGLYLRALTSGLAKIPAVPATLRGQLQDRLQREGLESLRRELHLRDPEAAARLAAGDTQRILRALEVVLGTGRTQSWWVQRSESSRRLEIDCFGLTLPRRVLYDRIEARVDAMLLAGWLDEIECLLTSGVMVSDPAFRAIGYRELGRHLSGTTTLEQARMDIITATRRYAKRQATWFKKEATVHWLDALDFDRLPDLVRVTSSLFSVDEGAR